MDRRFEQVDKRFEQVDKRFEQVDKRFEQVNKDFEGLRWQMREDRKWLEDKLFSKFANDWYTRIDPILVEIGKHREKEILWAEQDRRREEKVDLLTSDFKHQEKKIDQMGKTLDLVAKKIGV